MTQTQIVMDESVEEKAAEIGIAPQLMMAHMMAMQLNVLELGALLVKIGQEHEESVREWTKMGATCELDTIIQRDVQFVMSDMQRLGRVMMANHERHASHPDYQRRAEEVEAAVERDSADIH